MFNLRSVKALQRILTETNASIILTISHKTKYKLAQWPELFKSRGINSKTIHRLSTNNLWASRKDEILEWYAEKHIPNEEFVIMDDDKTLNALPDH